MNHDAYSNEYLRDILTSVKTIAVVGASEKPNRPSHGVMQFLQAAGYRVIPVNPATKATEILGEKVYRDLASVLVQIDMVDVFRRSEEVPPVVDSAIAAHAKVVWMQLGVRHDAAAAKAETASLKVVMNRCPAIEMPRLGLHREHGGHS